MRTRVMVIRNNADTFAPEHILDGERAHLVINCKHLLSYYILCNVIRKI